MGTAQVIFAVDRVRKYILRMRNRKLRRIRPSVTF
jgi:hypothetical protein